MTGKRQAAQDVTRALVLAAARRLFTEKGYEATNVRDIAAAAGRSTGSVFGNWRDKEALWEAAMGRKAPMVVVRDFLQQMSAEVAVLPLGSEGAALLLRDLYGTEG